MIVRYSPILHLLNCFCAVVCHITPAEILQHILIDFILLVRCVCGVLLLVLHPLIQLVCGVKFVFL